MYQRRRRMNYELIGSQSVKSNDVYRRITLPYDNNCMIQRRFTEWVKRIEER
jgi:hypothetical protein